MSREELMVAYLSDPPNLPLRRFPFLRPIDEGESDFGEEHGCCFEEFARGLKG